METYVHDLMIPNCKEWDKDLIEDMFVERDARAIFDIFLSLVWFKDCLLWHFRKNGHYFVKSGYRLLVNSLTSNADMHVPGQCEMIWSVKVPSKIKFCLKKACRDVLPMRSRLQTKGVVVPLTCMLCDRDVENCWHVFVTCPFARQCWVVANLLDKIGFFVGTCECFNDWFFF